MQAKDPHTHKRTHKHTLTVRKEPEVAVVDNGVQGLVQAVQGLLSGTHIRGSTNVHPYKGNREGKEEIGQKGTYIHTCIHTYNGRNNRGTHH